MTRPLCAGRVAGRRIISVAPTSDGRHVLVVLALQPTRVIQEVVLDHAPRSRAELLTLAESAQ